MKSGAQRAKNLGCFQRKGVKFQPFEEIQTGTFFKFENGKISESALTLIAKAAEGSVRDSLSLLDRALATQNVTEKEISEIQIRKMLGVADRSKILELLKFIFAGDQKASITLLREMVNEGIEPTNFLNDFLEIIYFIQQRKGAGNFDTDLSISETEQAIIDNISNEINVSTLCLLYTSDAADE